MIMRGFQRNLACTGAEEAAELGVLEGRDDGMFHYSFGENKDHLSHTHTQTKLHRQWEVFSHTGGFSVHLEECRPTPVTSPSHRG